MNIMEAADGSHLKGAMIALMPTEEDAERLALAGFEKASSLHATLFFLGPDGALYDEEARTYLAEAVANEVADTVVHQVKAQLFGAALWNTHRDNPVWVWQVGAGSDQDPKALAMAQEAAAFAVRYAIRGEAVDPTLIPRQHFPWIPHVTAAHTEDPDLLSAMLERLGPVTFDRVRVVFSGEFTEYYLAS